MKLSMLEFNGEPIGYRLSELPKSNKSLDMNCLVAKQLIDFLDMSQVLRGDTIQLHKEKDFYVSDNEKDVVYVSSTKECFYYINGETDLKDLNMRLVGVIAGSRPENSLAICKTNATGIFLRRLQNVSCNMYNEGSDPDFITMSAWKQAAENQGFDFYFVDSHIHKDPSGLDSFDWLEKNYRTVKEGYIVENQPGKSSDLINYLKKLLDVFVY